MENDDIWNNIVNFYNTQTGFITIIVGGVFVSCCFLSSIVSCGRKLICCC